MNKQNMVKKNQYGLYSWNMDYDLLLIMKLENKIAKQNKPKQKPQKLKIDQQDFILSTKLLV